MVTLSGADVSSYQGVIDWNTFKDNVNFVIIKSSEGNGFLDPQFSANQAGARNSGLPHGYYHFARPDLGNSSQDEANYFLSVVGALQEGEVLCLDFEVQYNDSVTWSKAFLDEVFTKTGVKPLFYSYQSMLTSNTWTPVVDEGYGLWVAAPGDPTQSPSFETGAWPSAAMWQWGTQNIPGISAGVTDSDQFFGDVTAFKAYGYHVPPPIPPTDPCAQYESQIADLTSKLATLSTGFTTLQNQFNEYKQTYPATVTVTVPVDPTQGTASSNPISNTPGVIAEASNPVNPSTSDQIKTSKSLWDTIKSIFTFKIF